jgi:hypothetical protein
MSKVKVKLIDEVLGEVGPYLVQFRFLSEKPWYGVAGANDLTTLFWQIDAHGDPHGCEIKNLRGEAFSVALEVEEDDRGDGAYWDPTGEIEVYGKVPETDLEGWFHPDWDNVDQ